MKLRLTTLKSIDTRTVDPTTAGSRLDQAIARLFPEVSRGRARQAISDGRVFVDGRRTRKNAHVVALGVSIRLAAAAVKPAHSMANPEVLFEDDCLAVVVKPALMAVEPTRGGDGGTLVRWFRDRGVRIGVVHRLDEAVRGLLVVAKKPFALKRLNEILRARTVTRRYRAVVEGSFRADSLTIDAPLLHRGKLREARTHVRVVRRDATTTLLEIELETGRTHQIRRHLAGLGHPIVGDVKYGARARHKSVGIALFAVELAFEHPRTREPMRFTIDVALD